MANRITTWTADIDRRTLRPTGNDSVMYFTETNTMRVSGLGDMTGKSLRMAAKDPSDIDGTTVLFNSVDVTTDSGWTDLENGKAGFTVDMNTSELQTYLSDSKVKSICIAIKDTTDNEMLSVDELPIWHPVILSDDDSPTAASKKQNFAATAAPTVTDDSSDGYDVGSTWWDITNDKVYGCIDATEGAAVWKLLSNGTAAVSSVFARTGDVVAVTGDYKDLNITSEASAMAANDIDFTSGDGHLTKTMGSNTTFTFSNPQLGRVIYLELDGNYTPTWPVTATVIGGGTYDGSVTNYVYIHCADSGTPAYNITISQGA